jgi:HK97 family phage major capsid protein
MSARLQALIDQRATAWSAVQDIRERVEREERVDLTTEENESYARGLTDVERLSRSIEDEQRAERLAAIDHTRTIPQTEGPAADEQRDYAAAFDVFMRRGMNDLTAEQRTLMARYEARDQSASTTTAGGYTVPQDFLVKITETLKAYGGIMGIANVIETTDGRTLPWPSDDDTANVGALITENTADSTQDLTFGQKQLSAYTYTSKAIKLSLELLQDTAFNLEAFVAKKIGQRVGRAVSAHLATGDGSSKPTGIGTAPTTGKTGATGQTGSIIYDDIVDLIHSVDAAYRNGGNCRFAMNDLSLAVVRKLKDTQGHPLWQPSVTAGVPDTLLSYGVTTDNGLPTMAANAKSILFGDFDAGYIIRQARNIDVVRLAERWADQRQVGFFGFLRIDAKPDDTAAVKAYVNSAT